MRSDLLIKLIAEDNYILELIGEHRLVRALVVPELGLPQEVEPGLLHHPGCPSELIGAEKDGSAEDAFEGGDQAAMSVATSYGALTLYLDFINLFRFLLYFMGGRSR